MTTDSAPGKQPRDDLFSSPIRRRPCGPSRGVNLAQGIFAGIATMRPPIRALTFDTFGTVVDWVTSINNGFRTFGRRKKPRNIDWTALIGEWKTYYRPGTEAVDEGRRP